MTAGMAVGEAVFIEPLRAWGVGEGRTVEVMETEGVTSWGEGPGMGTRGPWPPSVGGEGGRVLLILKALVPPGDRVWVRTMLRRF